VREKFHRLVGRAVGAEKIDLLIADTLAMFDGRVTPSQLLARIADARALAG
jgi:hypothetical protein